MGWGWGGRLFEAARLLTFSAIRMGAYSWWAQKSLKFEVNRANIERDTGI